MDVQPGLHLCCLHAKKSGFLATWLNCTCTYMMYSYKCVFGKNVKFKIKCDYILFMSFHVVLVMYGLH